MDLAVSPERSAWSSTAAQIRYRPASQALEKVTISIIMEVGDSKVS